MEANSRYLLSDLNTAELYEVEIIEVSEDAIKIKFEGKEPKWIAKIRLFNNYSIYNKIPS